MTNKIYYSIPDFYNLNHLNINLLNVKQKFPHMFRDNAIIDSIYGTFPGVIWNGGRVVHGYSEYRNIVNIITQYNKLGLSVRFTYTNCNIEEKHFSDHYGNLTLQIANELSGRYTNESGEKIYNGVNVNIPEFGEYVTRTYSKLYQLWSTTKDVKTIEGVNQLSEDTLTVTPYVFNNTSSLDELRHPENIEILCSDICVDNCASRQAHYQDISNDQMMLPNNKFMCPNNTNRYFYDNAPTRRHYVSPEKIEEYYLPRGINKFKLSGRTESFVNVIERYVIYLIKPEYKDIVRNYLLIGEIHNETI